MTRSASRSAMEMAARFVSRYGPTDRKTLRELADEFGVTPARMKTIIRTARPLFARKGLVTTVPVVEDRYVYVVTNELAEVARRMLRRIGPILSEMLRHDEDIRVVNNGNSPFGTFIDSLLDLAVELEEMTEDTLTPAP